MKLLVSSLGFTVDGGEALGSEVRREGAGGASGGAGRRGSSTAPLWRGLRAQWAAGLDVTRQELAAGLAQCRAEPPR